MLNTLFTQLKSNPSEDFESELIEFKAYSTESSLHNSKDLASEISALANTKGGKIIIGIKDSSNVSHGNWSDQLVGFTKVDLDTTKERILGKIKPSIELGLFEYSFEGKNYLIIDIPRRRDTLISTSNGKVCIREGKSSRAASPDEITRLVKGLQTYDWSAEDIDWENYFDLLNPVSLFEAKKDFCNRRNFTTKSISNSSFLESIGATKNGILGKGGLLFLGKSESILKFLGRYEYRFSWKTKSGDLKINDVWEDNIWNTIKRAKKHFLDCNKRITITFEQKKYELSTLDETAFHEAFLNAIVHRDYSFDGMISVNFTEKKLVITSPGRFYGGVTSENIAYHEPRHRNKALAKILMDFHLVDRAGMGVLRMGLQSLKYGRAFPLFKERNDSIEVSMQAEYFIAPIFVLTQDFLESMGIAELYIINSVYGVGYVKINDLESKLAKVLPNPWDSISEAMEDSKFAEYFEFKGTNSGIYICAKEHQYDFLDIKKPLRITSTSNKHVDVFKFLKKHDKASNEDIKNLLGYKYSSQTSNFLSKANYVMNTSKGRNSKWYLKR